MKSDYTVTVARAAARPLAGVRARLPIGSVSRRFREFLDQVYAAKRAGAVELDGQNIFVYSGDANGEFDVIFGVGTKKPFARTGDVEYLATPAGDAASATHWGDYSGLGAAHNAITSWVNANGRALAGPRWEVYGHWSDDPAKVRTDVFYLLAPA